MNPSSSSDNNLGSVIVIFSAGYIRHVFAQTWILTVCVVEGSGKKCNECVENGFERYGADKARVKLTGKLIVELCSAECHTFTTILIQSIGLQRVSAIFSALGIARVCSHGFRGHMSDSLGQVSHHSWDTFTAVDGRGGR